MTTTPKQSRVLSRKRRKVPVWYDEDDKLYACAVPGQPWNVMKSDSVEALMDDLYGVTNKRYEPEMGDEGEA